MPHARNRFALPRIQKKLKFFPVVAIQGARQTGKSFLARHLLKQILPDSKYLTFDQQTWKAEAQRAPHTFLTDHSGSGLLIIDEAQKVPDIFDAVKFDVDQNRIPGKFLLLGSTEFSKLAQIRESLTGRMGRVRLFPLTLAETLPAEPLAKSFERKQILQYLHSGGMPGFFSVRDQEERSALIQDWLDLTCLRDIQQFKTLNLDGELADSILKLTAVLEEPSRAAIARATRVDPRRIGTHLEALTELFVLQKLNPHPSGTGKPIYLPLDVGIAEYLGASMIRRLHIWLMNERMAKNAYFDQKRKSFYYYRSTGKRMIHLVEGSVDQATQAFQVIDHEGIRKTDAELMIAFLNKNPKAAGAVFAPIPEEQKIKSCIFMPWENIPSR